VGKKAMGAETDAAIQTKGVLFTFLLGQMNRAGDEEFLAQ